MMKAKEYLNQLPVLDISINQKIKELSALHEKLICVGSIDYTKEKVQSSLKCHDIFAESLQKINDLENKINSEIDRFVNKKHAIIKQIQALKNHNYIEVLYKRYVEYKSFQVIAHEMNYSYQYVLRIHSHALKEFQKNMKNHKKAIKSYEKL